MIKPLYTSFFHPAIRTTQLWLCLGLLLTVSSCFKEKPLAPPSNQNIGQTAVIEMGPEYHDQFFYNLETNSVVSQNSKYIYDLLFECKADQFNVWLNTAKSMSLVRTDKTSLGEVSILDTIGKDWHFELGEFNVDSNSFGPWWDSLGTQPSTAGKVYIINLGRGEDGLPIGFIKMKFNNFYGSSYSVTYAAIDASDSTTTLVPKDDTRNYAYLSLQTKNVLTNIEPDKSAWDLCITRYTIIFYQPYYLPYEVTGVLHNPSHVTAYMDSTVKFDSIQISDFDISRLETRRDAIGYLWKLIDDFGGTGTYSLKFHYTYFIKTDEDKYYKLRFFDFYRNQVKGYPSFEYYRL